MERSGSKIFNAIVLVSVPLESLNYYNSHLPQHLSAYEKQLYTHLTLIEMFTVHGTLLSEDLARCRILSQSSHDTSSENDFYKRYLLPSLLHAIPLASKGLNVYLVPSEFLPQNQTSMEQFAQHIKEVLPPSSEVSLIAIDVRNPHSQDQELLLFVNKELKTSENIIVSSGVIESGHSAVGKIADFILSRCKSDFPKEKVPVSAN